MLNRKISTLSMIGAAILGGVVTVIAVGYFHAVPVSAARINNADNCEFNFSRLSGYKYIQPLYLAEPKCEAGSFNILKSEIDAYVKAMKEKGDLGDASVYIKDFSNDSWMNYNTATIYHPGSLFKVITMITLFRMAETNPGLLRKEITFPANARLAPAQTFESKKIKPGNKYTVEQLISDMIIYSDNDATVLLHNHINNPTFTKTFSDLGLKKPSSVPDNNYELTVKEYSRFISVLYEGRYLTLPASEAAIALLCASDFSQGIGQKLPQGTIYAHKFGEAGETGSREFHESAIVYLNSQPYLVTIMTKGKDSEKLAGVISQISKMVYDRMAER